ncbi:hypothetical protein V6N13_148910 [Hibiscus sabdariffa]
MPFQVCHVPVRVGRDILGFRVGSNEGTNEDTYSEAETESLHSASDSETERKRRRFPEFNSDMILESMDKPILTMMKVIKCKIMARITAKKEAAENIIWTLCSKIQKKVDKTSMQSIRLVGRPQKNRRKEPGEPVTKIGRMRKIGAQMTCSKCGNRGHNKRSCWGQVGGNTSSNNNARVALRRTIRVAPRRTTMASRSNTSAHTACTATNAHARTSSTHNITEANKNLKLPVRRPTMSNPVTGSSYPQQGRQQSHGSVMTVRWMPSHQSTAKEPLTY